ncbi:helix-turn-helix domain-containing protein [Candidatus Nanohalovita haloferacivicina]|uniref:helix-turn-helix domain-containing protein n=1 Tax=Candidatus Nanohalovita haloferacivicina TaxID=2978046 RepID=UPI00325FAF1B|nr:hypothetical protein HBNXNv_0635 [Candidatus Nanohalobia archaeon BNXNv]
MRESADDPQRLINQSISRLDQLSTEEVEEVDRNHQGTVETIDNIDSLRRLAKGALNRPAEEIARDIDTEIMDEVYSSNRNNSSRRNEGYNEIRALRAVNKGIDPKMITGAKPGTVEEWFEDFRSSGLTYPSDEGEETTVEGEIFVNEYDNFLSNQGMDPESREAQDFVADVVGSLSRRSSAQKVTPLEGFLYAAEEEPSAAEIADSVDVSKRTVYNWMKKWNGDSEDGLGLIAGDPSDRRLTGRGYNTYQMVKNQHDALQLASEMKAQMMEELDERGIHNADIYGNRGLVEEYLENPELADRYMPSE